MCQVGEGRSAPGCDKDGVTQTSLLFCQIGLTETQQVLLDVVELWTVLIMGVMVDREVEVRLKETVTADIGY